MSEILEIVRRDEFGLKLRVRCANCGRVYVTNSPASTARKRKRCWACRPFIQDELRRLQAMGIRPLARCK